MKIRDFPVGLDYFYRGLYKAVNDPSMDSMISWSENGKRFIVWRPEDFRRNILSKCSLIACHDYKRFFSELHENGFIKFAGTEDRMVFKHRYFVRGRPDLLKKMQAKVEAKRMRKYIAAREAKETELANGLDHLRIR